MADDDIPYPVLEPVLGSLTSSKPTEIKKDSESKAESYDWDDGFKDPAWRS